MKLIFENIVREIDAGRAAVLATITEHHGSAPRGAGAQMLVGESGRLAGTVGGGTIEYEALRLADRLLREKRSELCRFELGGGEGSLDMICGGGVTVWLQYIPGDSGWADLAREVIRRIDSAVPGSLLLHWDGSIGTLVDGEASGHTPDGKAFSVPLPVGERAIIFGGGHCAAALVPILHSVGFRVTVFDERKEFTGRDRFPEADRLICGNYLRIGDDLAITQEDYIVVMTNGHRHDLEVEAQVLRGEFAYLGVMGSKKKTAAINEELTRRGVTQEDLQRIHAPIGLAIRSATPEEIAVSIAGEMILVRAQNREKKSGAQGRPCPA